MSGHFGHVVRRTISGPPRCGSRCLLSTSSGVKRKSPHAEWYSQVLPSMLPIALLGSATYIALHLVQTHLARERYADEAKARVEALESELETLRKRAASDAVAVEKELQSHRVRRWWLF